MMKNVISPLFLLVFAQVILAQSPQIIAHRGASQDAPENTLAAFKLAWEKGADAIEGDFRLTKDGKIICIHDKDTKRVSNKKLVVANSTYVQLRQLDVGLWKGKKWSGQKIPTLKEVIATIPKGKKLFLEVKSGLEIVSPLVKELVDLNVDKNQIVIIAFNSKIVAQMKKYLPRIKAYWLTAFVVDKKTKRMTPTLNTILKTLRDINANGLDSAALWLIDKKFVQTVKNAGFEYHVWTINSKDKGLYFKSLGVDSITTDRPKWLRLQLKNAKITYK